MNAIHIIGMLRENVDDVYRYFEYELPYDEDDETMSAKIIVKNWTNQSKTRLAVLPSNTRVALTGHLDRCEKFGTIIVVEQLEVISK